MACIRYIIPKFAQYIARSTAFTTAVVPRNVTSHSLTRIFSTTVPKPKRETITVYFIDRDGDRIAAKATVGMSFLEVAVDNDVELEDSYCESFHNYKTEDWSQITLEEPVRYCRVSVHFVCQDGSKLTAKAKVGDNLLDVVIDNDLDIDGFGACEGTLACSTCHLIFEQADFDKLPQEPTDEELDMLDLAYGLTDTSRLGCQIIVSKDMEGLTVRVPAGVADAREP